jgi:hypothetical protein
VSGFGQLGTFVAQEVPRLILSRDDQILAVQEECRALHANQQVLTGTLQNQNGLVPLHIPQISCNIPQSSSDNPKRPIQARDAPLFTKTSRTTTTSPSAASILSSFTLHLAGSRPLQDERPVSSSKRALSQPDPSKKGNSELVRTVSKSQPGKPSPLVDPWSIPLLVTMVPRDRVYRRSASHPQQNVQPDRSHPQLWFQFPVQVHWW